MKMDPHLLAQLENDGSEMKTVAKRYKVKMKDLRKILAEMKEKGEHPRSMDDVKAELEKRDYIYHPPKKRSKKQPFPLPEDTHAPDLPEGNVYVNG